MRGRNLIILGIAIVAGLFAVYLANAYFNSAEQREERRAEELRMARIAVATQDVAFGQPLTETNMRLVNWPANSVPTGAFTSIQEAVNGGRVALRPITVGEPILASKVSGSDGRATLASNLPEDMRAVAIPVNNVAGVGGFVRPGDVVDVMLTRQIPGDGAQATDKMTTVVLENTQVLAADLIADENQTQPVVTQTVTLQTDLFGAQKLALAREVGTFTLALRNVENQTVGGTETVVVTDLGGGNRRINGSRGGAIRNAGGVQPVINLSRSSSSGTMAALPRRPRGPTMSIIRGTEAETYEVER